MYTVTYLVQLFLAHIVFFHIQFIEATVQFMHILELLVECAQTVVIQP